MRRARQPQCARGVELAQQEQQRDRVRPARQRRDDTDAVAQQRVTAHGLERSGSEGRHCKLPMANTE